MTSEAKDATKSVANRNDHCRKPLSCLPSVVHRVQDETVFVESLGQKIAQINSVINNQLWGHGSPTLRVAPPRLLAGAISMTFEFAGRKPGCGTCARLPPVKGPSMICRALDIVEVHRASARHPTAPANLRSEGALRLKMMVRKMIVSMAGFRRRFSVPTSLGRVIGSARLLWNLQHGCAW